MVEGNTKTKSTVILRELVLGPGDVFDAVRMKISKLRLENTRFFDDVERDPAEHQHPRPQEHARSPSRRAARARSPSAPATARSSGRRSSRRSPSPTSTSSTLARCSRATARSSASGVQLGQLSNEVVLSFEEPWFLQKQLALGYSLFRTSSNYVSTYYNEVDLGAHGLRPQAPLRADRRPALVHLPGDRDQGRLHGGLAHHPGGRRQQHGVQARPPARARHPRQDHQHDHGQPPRGRPDPGRRAAGREEQLLQAGVPRVAVLQALRDADAGPLADRPRRRHPELRQEHDAFPITTPFTSAGPTTCAGSSTGTSARATSTGSRSAARPTGSSARSTRSTSSTRSASPCSTTRAS